MARGDHDRLEVECGRQKDPKTAHCNEAHAARVADEMKKACFAITSAVSSYSPGKLTVAQCLSDWLTAIKADVAPTTFISYENTVRLHLIPAIGELRLSNLGPGMCSDLKKKKLRRRKSRAPSKEAQRRAATDGVAASVQFDGKILPEDPADGPRSRLQARSCAAERGATCGLPQGGARRDRTLHRRTGDEVHRGHQGPSARRPIFRRHSQSDFGRERPLGLKWSAIDFERGTLLSASHCSVSRCPGRRARLLLREPKNGLAGGRSTFRGCASPPS